MFGVNTDVINNPHIVDCFFTQRVEESFVKHWLYDSLGAKWHWFRYEYQGRGSIHCHGSSEGLSLRGPKSGITWLEIVDTHAH